MQSLWAKAIFGWKGYWTFTKRGYDNKAAQWNPEDLNVDLSGRNIAITGANSGLGKSAAMALAQRGASVYMLCRNEERGNAAVQEVKEQTKNENVHLQVVDVSKSKQIIEFAEQWVKSEKPLHVLINNAGVLLNEKQTVEDGLEATFATNLLGCFSLTNLLLPVLIKTGTKEEPARVITMTSGGMYTKKLEVENIENYPHEKFDGVDAYANTKRAQSYLNEIWHTKISQKPNTHVSFYAVHPGWAATPGVETSLPSFSDKMDGKLRSSDEGADTAVWLAAVNQSKLVSGKLYFDREIAPTHFTGAGTQSPVKDVKVLWDKLSLFLLSYLDKHSEDQKLVEKVKECTQNFEFPASYSE